MKLVVDIGNSRVKWAAVRDGRLATGTGFARRGIDTALDDAWSGLEPPEAILISSVADTGTNARLEKWTASRWQRRPDWFRAGAETLGLVNGYTNPSQLGSDRWAALLGARVRYRGPVGVIDAGTAVTLDLVDGDGRHLGGVIAPGMELAAASLAGNTASIRESPQDAPGLLGRSTGQCVANGVRIGLAGAIERWMTEAEAILEGVTWMATGGSWPKLESIIDRRVDADPDLVLRGLAHVLEQR